MMVMVTAMAMADMVIGVIFQTAVLLVGRVCNLEADIATVLHQQRM